MIVEPAGTPETSSEPLGADAPAAGKSATVAATLPSKVDEVTSVAAAGAAVASPDSATVPIALVSKFIAALRSLACRGVALASREQIRSQTAESLIVVNFEPGRRGPDPQL